MLSVTTVAFTVIGVADLSLGLLDRALVTDHRPPPQRVEASARQDRGRPVMVGGT